MTGDVITGQGDHLDPPLLELWLQLHAFPQLGRADRGVIRGVGKQDAPTETTNTKKYTWNARILFIVIVQVHHVDLLSVICRNYYCVTFVFLSILIILKRITIWIGGVEALYLIKYI